MTKLKSAKLFYLTIFIIVIIYTCLEYYFPFIYDDWAMASYWKDNSVNEKFSIEAFRNFYRDVKWDANGRIANMVQPIFLFISPFKIFYPFLVGILIAVSIVFIQKTALYNQKVNNKFFWLSIVWSLVLIIIPWRDSIFVRSFALNYVFGSGLSLPFIYLLISSEKTKWSSVRFLFLIFYAVVVGGWHEGFSFTIIFGLLIYLIINRLKASKNFYIVLAVLICSSLFFLESPGMETRIGTALGKNQIFTNIFKFRISLLPFLIYNLFLLFSTFFNRGRKLLKQTFRNPFNIIGVGIIYSGFGIFVLLDQPLRATYWPSMFCCIFFVTEIYKYCKEFKFRKKFHLNQNITALFLVSICIIINVVIIHWVIRYNDESTFIINKFKENGGNTVFLDKIDSKQQPVYALAVPPRFIWDTPAHYFYYWAYTKNNFLGVIPSELEKSEYENSIDLKASNLGIRRYSKYLIMPFNDQTRSVILNNLPEYIGPRSVEVNIDYDGKSEKIQTIVIPFITKPYSHNNNVSMPDSLFYLATPKYINSKDITKVVIQSVDL